MHLASKEPPTKQENFDSNSKEHKIINFFDDFSNAMKENTTLQALDLNRNKISNEEVSKICDFLKVNSSLTSLGVDFNQIEDEGCEKLSEVLQNDNHSVKTLSLSL